MRKIRRGTTQRDPSKPYNRRGALRRNSDQGINSPATRRGWSGEKGCKRAFSQSLLKSGKVCGYRDEWPPVKVSVSGKGTGGVPCTSSISGRKRVRPCPGVPEGKGRSHRYTGRKEVAKKVTPDNQTGGVDYKKNNRGEYMYLCTRQGGLRRACRKRGGFRGVRGKRKKE